MTQLIGHAAALSICVGVSVSGLAWLSMMYKDRKDFTRREVSVEGLLTKLGLLCRWCMYCKVLISFEGNDIHHFCARKRNKLF